MAVQHREHVGAVGPHVSFSRLVNMFDYYILKIRVGVSKFAMGVLRPLTPPCLGPSLNRFFPYFSQFVIHRSHHSERHKIFKHLFIKEESHNTNICTDLMFRNPL